MDWIDSAFINRVGQRLELFKEKGRCRYNFRCPICGDSAKDKYKTRGWIFEKDGEVRFHCFNDESCGSNFSFFLFRIDKGMASEYRFEKFKEYGGGQRTANTEPVEQPPMQAGDPNHIHSLPTIASLPNDHPAKAYILDRKIPLFFHDKLYVTDQWKALTNQFEQTYTKIFKDESRIVIPAYNRSKELVCFQGRALEDGVDPKYLTVMARQDLKIWGMDRLRPNRPAFLLEGAFDAMFIDNACAMFGGTLSPSDLDPEFDWVYVLDNEPRNVSVLRRYQNLINQGAKFVSWSNWRYRFKDVNLCIQNGIPVTDIQRYFETNVVSGLQAQLQFDRWRKLPL